MSRAEIEAAASALRRAPRRSVVWDSAGLRPERVDRHDLVAACAARLTAGEPFYRSELVAELRESIDRAAYHQPAEAVVDQLLGRLTAAALRD